MGKRSFAKLVHGNVTFAEDKSLKTLDGMALFFVVFFLAQARQDPTTERMVVTKGSCRRFRLC
jgi:hypothetical protein